MHMLRVYDQSRDGDPSVKSPLVMSPDMSDSLISAGRLMEEAYNVNFRIHDDVLKDGPGFPSMGVALLLQTISL